MNYINLINQFWNLRRRTTITTLQSDLYFCLLQESNIRKWKNPFEMSNRQVNLTIGMSESSIVSARIRLQELGLIRFSNGIRNLKAPTYFICDTGCEVPDILPQPTLSFVDESAESAGQTHEDININLKKEKKVTAKRFITPSVDEVNAYCIARQNEVEAQRFVDFYASKGWFVGRTPMKDWKAAVRTWEKSSTKKTNTNGTEPRYKDL